MLASMGALVPVVISPRHDLRLLPNYAKLTGVPLPTPLPDFDISKARPRPYRPFRWAYHQHMSLKRLEPDWWLELESTYVERVAQRKALHVLHGKKIINALPGSEAACRELMEMVIQFLCARYPAQFELDQKKAVFSNRILGTCTDITSADPLKFLLENVPEDFAVMIEDKKTSLYYLRAGVICSAVGWNIAEKMGRPLHEIHEIVPYYKKVMEFSMNRYFRKMECSKPIQRASWGFEVGEESLFLQEGDDRFSKRATQDPELRRQDIHLRVDWQTLRRLPRSQAIVFNYKALFTPLEQLKHEAYIPKLLRKILKEGDASIMQYKGVKYTLHKVLPALEEYAEEQEKKGWVPKDWEEKTLDEDPFFPNWQEIYNR
ncbi:hypothetical protein FISHEDRAFT_68068 [Fistulina hepatica ATCC 64428]|nr:hypothetical protein FISHEDRAFT_68068 [Fistulina hepatica ATCC 64428]